MGSFALGSLQRPDDQDAHAAAPAASTPSNLTFGGYSSSFSSSKDFPDLVAVVMDDCGTGYVYRDELFGDVSAGRPWALTAYARDGSTEIGSFSIATE